MKGQCGAQCGSIMKDTFVHKRIFKSIEGGVVVQDGAVDHEVMWLMVATVNNERFQSVDKFFAYRLTIRCVQCLCVLPPLCFYELLPIFHNVLGEMVMSGPPLYNVACALYVVVM